MALMAPSAANLLLSAIESQLDLLLLTEKSHYTIKLSYK